MSNYRYIHPERKLAITTASGCWKNSDIANALAMSTRTVRRTLKRWDETGKVEGTKRSGRPQTLSEQDIKFIEGLIARKADMYVFEINAALYKVRETDVDDTTISRTLKRLGYSRKKVTRPSLERDEEARIQYQARVGMLYPPETLVFVDESATNRHTARRSMAWSKVGDRASKRDFFVRGARYSILPAISLDGVLHLDILTRSWTGDAFRAYVDALLSKMNPYPLPNSVLVMDNASPHRFPGIQEMVEARGMRLLYLPAYSPDFNPIEEGFSALKAWIRRHQDHVLGELSGEPQADPIAMLWEGVFTSMTQESIVGWYRDCGYIV